MSLKIKLMSVIINNKILAVSFVVKKIPIKLLQSRWLLLIWKSALSSDGFRLSAVLMILNVWYR